jgi:hypothetical protein
MSERTSIQSTKSFGSVIEPIRSRFHCARRAVTCEVVLCA